MKRYLLSIFSVFILTLLPVCNHKDICFEDGESGDIIVTFDWRYASDANPASMVVYFFEPTGENSHLRFIFPNKTGGEIRIPYGNYCALGMNSDNTDWARIRHDEDIDSFETYTDDAEGTEAYGLTTRALPRAAGTEQERMAKTPGMLWTARHDNISLTFSTEDQIIPFFPVEAVCHYTVDIYDVKNIDNIDRTEIDGTISGMAEAYIHGSNRTSDTHVTMPFTLSADKEASSLHAEFLTFGESANNPGNHKLTIYLILKDGTKWYYTFDVTSQVSKAPDPHHVHIVLRGLPLPKSLTGTGGFRPDVTDWQTEDIELKM